MADRHPSSIGAIHLPILSIIHFEAPDMRMRTEQEIFNDLAALCVSPGYIHAFALLCFRDTIVGFSDELKTRDMVKMFRPSALIRTELTTLLGLMIRQPVDFSLPPESVIDFYMSQSDELLADLHKAIMSEAELTITSNNHRSNFNPFSTGAVLREAIFYGGESAYTFQYRDFAPLKYASDCSWLEQNRGFNMRSARDVTKAITDTLNTHLMSSLKDARTKPRNEFTILRGFTFTGSEIADRTKLPITLVADIIGAFCAPIEGTNTSFTSLRAFNAAYESPIIRHSTDKYILFQAYGLTEALYDAPFYWMLRDKDYKPTALKNRGDFTENFSHGRLSTVFKETQTFKNVELSRRKGATIGEIDVLVIFGDQAVVVQAKSKKLTLEARNGNEFQLKGDFKAAVQDAVTQALDYASLIGDPTVTLKCRDGKIVHIDARPNKIYPVVVVSDHYPALAFQARQFIDYIETEQLLAPLVIDVFSLDAIAEFLTSPLRLLSYLRLRALYGKTFWVTHEHVLLSYHLKKNLWQSDFDILVLGDDVSSDLDIAMASRRDNVPGAKTPTGILTVFADTPFDRLLTQIEGRPEPVAIALGFLLLELNSDTIKALNRNISRVLRLVAKDGNLHDLTMGLGTSSAGLTIHGSNLPASEANEILYEHCRLRKYSQKADRWYGVALRPDATIQLAATLTGPWEFNPQLEVTSAQMPSQKAGFRMRARVGPQKPRRNDRCSCGSGKKYKNCHGKQGRG